MFVVVFVDANVTSSVDLSFSKMTTPRYT